MLLMLADHLGYVFDVAEVRLTLGRLAMPMFFLLAGSLVRSPRWRHAAIGIVGVVLPLVVPWIDAPNVLTLWALGVVVLWGCRRCGVPVWLLAGLGLTLGANGWVTGGNTYDPACLWGLMALGAMVPATAYRWADRLPAWVGTLGRHPVAFYVGHLLVLQALIEAGL